MSLIILKTENVRDAWPIGEAFVQQGAGYIPWVDAMATAARPRIEAAIERAKDKPVVFTTDSDYVAQDLMIHYPDAIAFHLAPFAGPVMCNPGTKIFAFIGGEGAGKTTLCKAFNGLSTLFEELSSANLAHGNRMIQSALRSPVASPFLITSRESIIGQRLKDWLPRNGQVYHVWPILRRNWEGSNG